MTTMTYEERLLDFAEGKRLGQLAKAVWDPEDGVCDACGSALPRTLFDDASTGRREDANAPPPRPSLRALRRTFIVAGTESHYEVLVRLEDGQRRVSGHAQEPRWSQGWARQDGGVMLLERVPRARPNAVTICLLRAYREARRAWRNGTEPNGDRPVDRMGQGVPT